MKNYYMLVVIFSKCMASSSFDPLGICAINVGDNVIVGFIQSGIPNSFKQNHFLKVVRFFFFF